MNASFFPDGHSSRIVYIVTIVTENGVCRKVYSTFLAYRGGYKYAAYRARRASCLTSVSCVSDVIDDVSEGGGESVVRRLC
jgi:hypothetical protein